jgi:hypothetical protein
MGAAKHDERDNGQEDRTPGEDAAEQQPNERLRAQGVRRRELCRCPRDRLLRRTPNQIAERMNELRVIAGMGGKRWTAQKVRKALAEYARRREQHQEAA